ncbi:efflux RND transporter periplasmic adaptor subunit [Billgrantia kenyensis]|uniref:Efflux RND transporter periplasmic adaptor subunit n=1 Tax=Billgrantia kenyensis TaxID=321266 RepID=A0A7V9W180_9GAMM|nr:efflux RND transporter periplasmic adaptor subunit [Halomonas kenyensis]MBA2779158.1 efflux RND transporter periplasmic adaptor subunit [Halomonas kenyensis]MCG6660798.1 efflux RND transporter periplasmic adaptor subunit [Halomonas kenyensis]
MLKRPPISSLLAILLLLALLLWLALGDIQRFQREAPSAEAPSDETLPRVEFRTSQATPYTPRRVVQGQLEAHREVELRTRHAGRVVDLPVAQGISVEAGAPLLALTRDALEAQLERAEDRLALARAELAGAEDLRQRNLISQPELLRLQSSVSVAAAELAELRQAFDETRPSAPFDGVLDRLYVELGEVLQIGEAFARLVDDRRLTASAWVAQRDAHELSPGLPVEARLLDGSRLTGELTHVSSRADEATRSFYIEAEFDNPERRRLAGASATLAISLPEREVHRFSPALLELDEEGRLRVKHLDEEDRVVSTPITLVAINATEARVDGLPDTIRLISLGGGFVAPGDGVVAVPAQDAAEPVAENSANAGTEPESP